MAEERNKKLFWVIVVEPFGLVGTIFMFIGLANLLLYGVNLPENPSIWGFVFAWLYPVFFILLGTAFLLISLHILKRDALRFLKDIRERRRKLERKLREFDKGIGYETVITDSEFGVNSVDIEVLKVLEESGGFAPILRKELQDTPFSTEEVITSLAKLWLLGYIRIPEGKGMKITITSRGIDALKLPESTFASKIPEDIALMVAHANHLYREGKFDEVIIKCNNILERALKVHLIPSVEDYKDKWNEKVRAKFGNSKGVEQFFWKGERTKASLNDLWNFYRKNADMGRRWEELADRNVKYISKYMEALKEMDRVVDKGVDTVADIRARYAHDKPENRYEKDAYRILKLTEIILGVMFETLKQRVGMKSERLETAEGMLL